MANPIDLNPGADNSSIRYRVIENPAATKLKGESVYTAKVYTGKLASLAEVADRMIAEGCPFPRTYIVAILNDMATVMGHLLRGGTGVNIGGLVSLRPSIKGTFASDKADFDSTKQKLKIVACSGSKIRNYASGATTENIGKVYGLPVLDETFSLATGGKNVITSEGGIIVVGKKLEWGDEAADEGFFLNYEGVETKFTVTGVPTPTSVALVTAQVMEEGDTAELWFRTRMGGDTLVQVKLAANLTCVAAE